MLHVDDVTVVVTHRGLIRLKVAHVEFVGELEEHPCLGEEHVLGRVVGIGASTVVHCHGHPG